MNLIAVFLRPDDTLAVAKNLVQSSGARHLPVLEGDKPIGMISLTDLYALECLNAADLEAVRACDVMTKNLLSVDRLTPVDEVAREMTRRRIGSAVVEKDGKPVGIFTASNACWVLGNGMPARNRISALPGAEAAAPPAGLNAFAPGHP